MFLKRKLYYAHSMRTYDTPKEKRETEILEACFPKYYIFCPNKKSPVKWQSLRGNEVMQECFKRVKKSRVIVATEYKGTVGKGVFEEVKLALKLKKLVYVLRAFTLTIITDVEIVDRNNWAGGYGKIITT